MSDDARTGRGRAFAVVLLAASLAAGAACERDLETALARRDEARALAAAMRIELYRSDAAVQRAVIADSSEVSAEATREADEATRALERDREVLAPLLASLRFADEERLLQEFAQRFAESREVDRELLALAAESTNLAAQRLAFGPAREAADAIRDRLADALRSAPAADATRAALLAARAELGVRQVEALTAPHIAEPDDAAMTQLEGQMAAAEAAARSSLAELEGLLGSAGREALGSARGELDRFAELQRQIVALSRRNTNVRSLAVTLGRKRRLTAACDETLAALQEALAKHEWRATR